ncbi:MAG TPA: hypothetical protein VGD67_01435 [Pseudonocardiaceae bacterium]
MTPSRRRPRALSGLLIGMTFTASAALIAPLVPSAAAAPDAGIQADTDVYIRDYVGDVGVEPHGNSVWTSPDIKVCHTPVECPTSLNPEVGSTNYIFVKLNNPGPYGSGDDVGSLDVYRSTPGGGTAWINDWTSIGGALGVSVPAGGTTTVMIPWDGVPGPGHFCLLARWESESDPMTYAEGPNTVLNTQRNNNLAWRNVDSVDLFYGKPEVRPYAIGNPGREWIRTDLAFTDVKGGFMAAGGRLTIDLGEEVYRLWREGGGEATGVKQIGETTFEIADLRRARFYGILLEPGTRPVTQLEFSVGRELIKSRHVIRVNQFAPLEEQGGRELVDVGGVEYRVTIAG